MTLASLSTFVVGSHSTKNDGESVLVDDGWVIASGEGCLELSDPGVGEEWIELNGRECMAAVSTNHDGKILENMSCMSLPWLWFPSLEFKGLTPNVIDDIFGIGLVCWFLDDFSDILIQGG